MEPGSKPKGCRRAVLLGLALLAGWLAIGSHLAQAAKAAHQRALDAAAITSGDTGPLAAALDEASRADTLQLRIFPTDTATKGRAEVDRLLAALLVPSSEPARAASALDDFVGAASPGPFVDAARRLAVSRRQDEAIRNRVAFWERVATAPTVTDLRVLARLEHEAPHPSVARHLEALRPASDFYLQVPATEYGSGASLSQASPSWSSAATAHGAVAE